MKMLLFGLCDRHPGGSAAVPEGEVVVRLYDGAVGPTHLAHAQAQASLGAGQQLAFSADLAPAEAGRHSGHVRVSGVVPLRAVPLPGTRAPPTTPASHASPTVKCLLHGEGKEEEEEEKEERRRGIRGRERGGEEEQKRERRGSWLDV